MHILATLSIWLIKIIDIFLKRNNWKTRTLVHLTLTSNQVKFKHHISMFQVHVHSQVCTWCLCQLWIRSHRWSYLGSRLQRQRHTENSTYLLITLMFVWTNLVTRFLYFFFTASSSLFIQHDSRKSCVRIYIFGNSSEASGHIIFLFSIFLERLLNMSTSIN